MKEPTIVKCRTAHPCEDCDTEIQPGELADYEEGRTPTYTNPDNWKNERQTGIAYWKTWRHGGRRNCLYAAGKTKEEVEALFKAESQANWDAVILDTEGRKP
jgi:hypothetical protein